MDPLYTFRKGDPDALLGRALIVPDDSDDDSESLMVAYTSAGMRLLLASSKNDDVAYAVDFIDDAYSPEGQFLFGSGYDPGDNLNGIDGDILFVPAALNDVQNTLRLSAAANHYLDTYLSQRLPPFYILVSDLRAAIESRDGYRELLNRLGNFRDLFHYPEDFQNLQKLPELSRYRNRFQLMSLLLDSVVAEIGDDYPTQHRIFKRLVHYRLTKNVAKRELRHIPVKRPLQK